jgi:hypothetical protein
LEKVIDIPHLGNFLGALSSRLQPRTVGGASRSALASRPPLVADADAQFDGSTRILEFTFTLASGVLFNFAFCPLHFPFLSFPFFFLPDSFLSFLTLSNYSSVFYFAVQRDTSLTLRDNGAEV